MNTDTLNLREQQIILKLAKVTGLMEEKHRALLDQGVFDEYRRIYGDYARLIGPTSEGIEALKRAVFLGWYEFAEPGCFSGLFDLPKETTRMVMKSLGEKIKYDDLDFELRWMLPYYNSIIDLPFLVYMDSKSRKEFFEVTDPNLWQRVQIDAEGFKGRGQMGKYWQSVLQARIQAGDNDAV